MIWQRDCAQTLRQWKTSLAHGMDGRGSQPPALKPTLGAPFVAHDGLRRRGPDPIAIWPSGFSSLRCFPPLAGSPSLVPNSSAPSFSVASTFPSTRYCRCGRPFDCLGHHRAACSVAGILGKRGFPLENAAARVCREAGTRIQTNVMVREMDLVPNVDNRRSSPTDFRCLVEPSSPQVSALRRDGTSRPQNSIDGMTLAAARRNKARTCGGDGRARLIVLPAEVGGRRPEEAVKFLVPLPPPRQGLLQCCFSRACVLLGSIIGEVCWHAQQPVVLLTPWATLHLGWIRLFHPCRMCCVISGGVDLS